MQFATALIAPVAAMTEQEVAARASGESIEFSGKTKSIGWKVAELTGQVVEDVLMDVVGHVADHCLRVGVVVRRASPDWSR